MRSFKRNRVQLTTEASGKRDTRSSLIWLKPEVGGPGLGTLGKDFGFITSHEVRVMADVYLTSGLH